MCQARERGTLDVLLQAAEEEVARSGSRSLAFEESVVPTVPEILGEEAVKVFGLRKDGSSPNPALRNCPLMAVNRDTLAVCFPWLNNDTQGWSDLRVWTRLPPQHVAGLFPTLLVPAAPRLSPSTWDERNTIHMEICQRFSHWPVMFCVEF